MSATRGWGDAVLSHLVGLFAGVGGIEQGFQLLGVGVRMLVEIDPAARLVLGAKFPGADIAEDVAGLHGLPADTRILVAGFPCQDLSPPGGKSGLEGAQSGLVRHVFRLLRTVKDVEWLVLENVPFMLRLDGGSAMSSIVRELDRLGWRWAYRTVDAICVVPQRRRRVVLLASPCHDPNVVLYGDDFVAADDRSWAPGEAAGFYWTEGRRGAGLRREAVPTLKVGSGVGIPSAPAILTADGDLGMPSIRDAERLQGFPADWTAAAEGVSRAVRWKLVGNAVPPPLASWLADRIVNPPGIGTRVRLEELRLRGGWPSAACGNGRTRHQVRIGEGFSEAARPLLSAVLREPLTALSPRALKGFLSRARTGGMRWPNGFLDRIAAYA